MKSNITEKCYGLLKLKLALKFLKYGAWINFYFKISISTMKKEQIVKPFLFNILTLDSDGFMRLQAFEVHSFNNLLIAYQSLNSSLLETLVCSLGNI